MMSHKPSKVVRVVTAVLLGVALAGPIVTPLVAEASSNSTQGTLSMTAEVVDTHIEIQCHSNSKHRWIGGHTYKVIQFHRTYYNAGATKLSENASFPCIYDTHHTATRTVYKHHYELK